MNRYTYDRLVEYVRATKAHDETTSRLELVVVKVRDAIQLQGISEARPEGKFSAKNPEVTMA